MRRLEFGPDEGSLTLTTGVEGRAKRMGHRLTIELRQWHVAVDFDDDVPVSALLTVIVDSLVVVKGEGGVKPLSGPEKSLVHGNAMGSLRAKDFPEIGYAATEITETGDGYVLRGQLTIADVTAEKLVEVRVADEGLDWLIETETSVAQSDFGISPYSLMMGSLKVGDSVAVQFRARVSKS